MPYLFGTVVLFLLAAICSGCSTTRTVLNAGKRTEILGGPQSVRIASDGSIALEVEASYFARRCGFWREGKVVYTRKKYLVGSPEAVGKSIQEALASNCTKGRKNIWHLPDNALCLCHMPYSATNAPAWQLVPLGFGGDDAILKQLPAKFTEPTTTVSRGQFGGSDWVPYAIDNKNYSLQFHVWCNAAESRKEREWWGYPMQILIIPAFAADIITFPYQCVKGVQAYNRAWGGG